MDLHAVTLFNHARESVFTKAGVVEDEKEKLRLQLTQENDLLLQQKDEEWQQSMADEQAFSSELANILLSLVAQPAMAIAICFCIFSAPLILSMETLVFACASIVIGLAAYIFMYGWQALLALLWSFLKWLGVQGGLRLILIGCFVGCPLDDQRQGRAVAFGHSGTQRQPSEQ